MPVGEEIICFCSSCKLDLRHVIVAHKSGNSGPVSKVRCNTCKKIHAYRNNPSAKAAVRTKKESAPREKVQVIPIEVEWREQLRSNENKPSVKYAPTGEFKVGDVIDHPTFGCGIVRAMKDANKFEVLFQRDVKMLVHKLKED
ncbi:MAG: hypothetical protein ACXWQO_00445 [Bdellovibrionota bacterium]